MDIKNLINFLPFEYKDQDTYKVNGKGILERFLEICGSYFQDIITPDIDNILDIIDYDTCPDMFLNYLWESFGQLPFARWNNIDEAAFKIYYNGLLSKSEIDSLKNKWILPKTGPFTLSSSQIRNLLKYSISLLKIRGTSQFFEILFRMYGLTCTITDPAKSNYDGWLKTHPYFDQDQYYDKSNFDNIYACGQCIEVTFKISGHGYTSNTNEFKEFRKAVENIIDRFKPYHVGAKIDYGFEVNDNYAIFATLVNKDVNKIIPGYITQVPILITVSSDYQDADLRYQVSGDGITWGYTKYDSGTIFNALIGDQKYYFRSVGDPSKVVDITVGSGSIIKSYNISVNPPTLALSPTNKEGTVIVTASVYQDGKQTPVKVQMVGSSEVKESGDTFKFTEAGTYEFQIVDYPVKRTSVVVTKEPNKYKVICTPTEFKLNDSISKASTVLKVEDLYGEKDLECYCIGGSGAIYKSEDVFEVFGTGVFKFACTKDTLETSEGIGTFTVYRVYSKFTYQLDVGTQNLVLIGESVNQEINLSISPKSDPDGLMDYGVEIWRDNQKVDDLDLIEQSVGNASGTYVCKEAGSYRVISKGDPSVYAEWSVSVMASYEEPFIYIVPVDASDPNWISPNWSDEKLTNNQKVAAEYQLVEGGKALFKILPFDMDGYTSVINQTTGEEHEFGDTITLDKAGIYVYYVKGQENKPNRKVTVTVKDYELVVNISCSPTEYLLGADGSGEAVTKVVCSSNHSDFVTDVRLVGQADSHPVPYEFRTTNPGEYIFEAINKTDVRCTFTVKLAFDVEPSELVWTSEDTSSKTFEINIPGTTPWKITMD